MVAVTSVHSIGDLKPNNSLTAEQLHANSVFPQNKSVILQLQI